MYITFPLPLLIIMIVALVALIIIEMRSIKQDFEIIDTAQRAVVCAENLANENKRLRRFNIHLAGVVYNLATQNNNNPNNPGNENSETK